MYILTELSSTDNELPIFLSVKGGSDMHSFDFFLGHGSWLIEFERLQLFDLESPVLEREIGQNV